MADDNVTTTRWHVTENTTNVEVTRRQTLSIFINLLLPPVLTTVGVTCGAMTILTMRTKYFRRVSASVYLKTGALNDILALLILLTAHWLYLNQPGAFVRTESSHLMCKFFNFYGTGNIDFGMLLTVAMTTERALSIASPFCVAKYLSVKRAWRIVLGILCVSVLKNSHFLLASDLVPEGRTDRLCDTFPERIGPGYEAFLYDVWPWIHVTFVILCGITLVVNNSVILYFVYQSQADRFSGGQTWRHLVPMLIGESMLLIALTFPFTLHLALLAIRIKYDSTIYTDPHKASAETLVFSVTFYMLYSNKCANFFMFCATGSRFRDGLTSALLNCVYKRKSRTMLFSKEKAKLSKIYANKVHRLQLFRTDITATESPERYTITETLEASKIITESAKLILDPRLLIESSVETRSIRHNKHTSEHSGHNQTEALENCSDTTSDTKTGHMEDQVQRMNPSKVIMVHSNTSGQDQNGTSDSEVACESIQPNSVKNPNVPLEPKENCDTTPASFEQIRNKDPIVSYEPNTNCEVIPLRELKYIEKGVNTVAIEGGKDFNLLVGMSFCDKETQTNPIESTENRNKENVCQKIQLGDDLFLRKEMNHATKQTNEAYSFYI
ncbi:hypothetical protein DPMN_127325 [Dreissena polymorpha]|uniref:G-protein coupled receptors family 1 profile domain-containing protein n=1 Tax=Dreissena polymorpha TaxID=45954 RepID=A0A9D4H124_DREPO|nr:hypothetical protein DPMN_127325 [Dreissena polymorpha]